MGLGCGALCCGALGDALGAVSRGLRARSKRHGQALSPSAPASGTAASRAASPLDRGLERQRAQVDAKLSRRRQAKECEAVVPSAPVDVPVGCEAAVPPAPADASIGCEVMRTASWKSHDSGTSAELVSMVGRLLHEEFHMTAVTLGSGMNGPVLLGRRRCQDLGAGVATRRKDALVAIKTLRKRGLQDCQLRAVLNEVDVYLKMDHANVARLLRVFDEPEEVHLVMELCSGGSLGDRLHRFGPYNSQGAAAAIRQVLRAVSYLHGHPNGKVCHRDLKHSNFVFKSPEWTSDLKLVDFGLSRVLRSQRPQLGAYAGTLLYMAPEVVLQQKFDEACDIWSVGVIAYTLLCGLPPFSGRTEGELAKAIVQAQLPAMRGGAWERVHDDARSFMRLLLQADPRKRPSADEALRLPWPVAPAGAAARAEAGLVLAQGRRTGSEPALPQPVAHGMRRLVSDLPTRQSCVESGDEPAPLRRPPVFPGQARPRPAASVAAGVGLERSRASQSGRGIRRHGFDHMPTWPL